MSEPIRTNAAKRAKLALALKRNMARRKAASEPCTANNTRGQKAECQRSDLELRSAGACPVEGRGREPRAAGAQRSVGDEGAPSIKGEAQ